MNKGLLLFLVLLIALIWLTWPWNLSNEHLEQPNIVSQKNQPEVANKSSDKSEFKNETPQTFSEQITTNTQAEIQGGDETFSYLQLYRNYRYMSSCHLGEVDFNSAQSIASAKQLKLDQFEVSGQSINIQVSASHLSDYEAHLDRCIILLEKYQGMNLAEELLTAPTVTKKEKQLKKLRNLIQPWDDAWQHLFRVANGHDNPEAQSLLNQIAELDEDFKQQYGHIDVQFIRAEQTAHYQAKQPLYDQLKLVNKVDLNAKAQVQLHVNELKKDIKSFMLLHDGDLFYEASLLLSDDWGLRWRWLNAKLNSSSYKRGNIEKLNVTYETVGSEVLSLVGDISQINYKAIAPYANLLYVCAIGADCSIGSALMNNFCLKPAHPSACEKDMMAFFADDYLSPNQMEDVLNLLDLLVIIYAP